MPYAVKVAEIVMKSDKPISAADREAVIKLLSGSVEVLSNFTALYLDNVIEVDVERIRLADR